MKDLAKVVFVFVFIVVIIAAVSGILITGRIPLFPGVFIGSFIIFKILRSRMKRH